MATVVFKGLYDSLVGGSLSGTPDLRVLLVMAGFTGATEEDSVNLVDITTLDEFDGLGYVRLDCAGVSVAYDATNNRYAIDFTNGVGNEFGDPVAPGTGVIAGLVLYLYVDGTAANDVILLFTDQGAVAGVNAANGPLGLTLPADGLVFVQAA